MFDYDLSDFPKMNQQKDLKYNKSLFMESIYALKI